VNAFVKLPGGSRAVYNSSGLAYYRHSDHLGNSRLATTTTRTKYFDVAYAPYGEDYNGSGTTPDLAFTDQNQDTVGGGWSNNLYDFMLREYRTAHGRWTSPDPAGLGAVDPTNPQSWNRYAYVLNNPMAMVDLLGDDGCYFGDSYIDGGVADDCWAQGGTWYNSTTGTLAAPPTTVTVTADPGPDPYPGETCDPGSACWEYWTNQTVQALLAANNFASEGVAPYPLGGGGGSALSGPMPTSIAASCNSQAQAASDTQPDAMPGPQNLLDAFYGAVAGYLTGKTPGAAAKGGALGLVARGIGHTLQKGWAYTAVLNSCYAGEGINAAAF